MFNVNASDVQLGLTKNNVKLELVCRKRAVSNSRPARR